MFPDGKPLALAPNISTYPPEDMSVCRKLAAKRKHMLIEKLKENTNRPKMTDRKRQNAVRSSSNARKYGYSLMFKMLVTVAIFSNIQKHT